MVAAAEYRSTSMVEPVLFDTSIRLSIVVPGVTGHMSALALFIFMTNWDSHLWPLLIASDDKHRTLPVGLAAMQSNNLGDTGVPIVLMAAILALLPTVLLFITATSRWRIGRIEGGVMLAAYVSYCVWLGMNSAV